MFLKIPELQFVVVDKNCKLQEALYSISSQKICLHAFKIQLVQQLKPNDHTQRREFVEWIIEHQQVDADFSSKVMLND